MVGVLDGLPRGATAISDFSPQIEEAIEKGWLYASLMFGAGRVRTGHLIFGMLKTPTLKNALFSISREWRKVEPDRLGEQFNAICGGFSPSEAAQAAEAGQAGVEPGGVDAPQAAAGPGEALSKYSIDLTEKARKGELDKIVGCPTMCGSPLCR